MNEITDPAALREHFGPVSPLAARKTMPKLDAHFRAFLALSPFAVLATCDDAGLTRHSGRPHDGPPEADGKPNRQPDDDTDDHGSQGNERV